MAPVACSLEAMISLRLFRYGTFLGAMPLPHMCTVDASQEGAFGVGRTEPSARYDLTQTSPVTSERRSLVGDLRVREVSYVLSPMYNVSVGAVDSSTPPRHSVAIHATRSQPEGVLSSTRLDTTPSLGSWSLLALALCPPRDLCFFFQAPCFFQRCSGGLP